MTLGSDLQKDIVNFIKSTLEQCITNVDSLGFNKENGQQILSVCLYVHIIELITASIKIYENKIFIGLPILLRSIFEAEIDLINCIGDPNYYKSMYASFLNEKIKVIKEAERNAMNPYLFIMRKSTDVSSELSITQKELDGLKNKGFKPLKILERCKKANRENEYRTIYNMLCLDTHNNLRSLEEHHIQKSKEDWHVELFKNPSLSDLISYLTVLSGVLVNASIMIHKFLQTPNISFDDLASQFENLKKRCIQYAKSQ